MKKQLIALTTLITLPMASGVSIGFLDFESSEDGFFSFAENSGNVQTIQVITGAGGTDGIATRVIDNPGAFAGGGIGAADGPFDLAMAGILGGNVTNADFAGITGSFDVNIPIGQQIAIRIEPGNGGFPERADLNITIDGTGDFQTVNFDTSNVDPVQQATFINTLNSQNVTGVKFIFQINNQAGAVGSDFVFDNLELNAVPEPSTTGVLALGGGLALLRRRRK